MSHDLSGRTVVVTGAARGMGRSIADRFAAAGAKVVLWGRQATVEPPGSLPLARLVFLRCRRVCAFFLVSVPGLIDEVGLDCGRVPIG
jgi:NAD(P)-dependent dehydrogenase (short-subunit alcohol dehydrogenase family)